MGAWSHDIMGGDTPLDWLSFICTSMGYDFDGDNYGEGENFFGYNLSKDVVNEKLHLAIDTVKNDSTMGSYSHDIGWFVLGAVIMRTGADMPEPVRNTILSAVKDYPNLSTWSAQEKRKYYLDDLYNKVKDYNGTPTKLEEEY